MWSFFSRDPTKDFNYDIGEPFSGLEDKSLWKLHRGKRKGGGESISVFVYDIKNGSDAQLELVKGFVKKLKTLRHPNILTYLDSLESDKVIYLVTEYVEPLEEHLSSGNRSEKQKELEISWGLLQIAKGLSFLNNDCSLMHNNVCLSSVFVNQAGEWKLGSVEYMTSYLQRPEKPPIKIFPLLEKYNPPEYSSNHIGSTKWSADMWGLGCLIWEVFNGPLSKPFSLQNIGKIPKSLRSLYCELVRENSASRPNPKEFINHCQVPGGFLNNNFINTLLFLEEIQIKDTNEKTKFFTNLTPLLDNFPSEICKYKILPQLINAYEFGNAGSAVLSPMFKLGKLLSPEEYQKKIVPCVVKLFSSSDRATRARLLQQLEHFVDHLQPSLVNDQIFPQVLHGFMDTNPTIRETTVKSMLYLAPKLNYNNLNVELMKHFARLQAKDDQGGIRTNTTVCLGKIATHLHPQTRQKVLIAAFGRAMRDPFPPARIAAILALAATQSFFVMKDVATKVLPMLSCLCIDPEKSVRDQAFKTMKGFLGKLEKVSEDPSLLSEMEAEVNTISSPTVVDTAASWAGWAVSSLTSKFYKSGKAGSPMREQTPTEDNAQSVSSSTSKNPSNITAQAKQDDKRLDAQPLETDTFGSDEEENWSEDWGEMDSKPNQGNAGVSASFAAASDDAAVDGWDDEDWGSLENPTTEGDNTVDSFKQVPSKSSDDWNDNWKTELSAAEKLASAYDWGSTSHQTDDFFSSGVKEKKPTFTSSVEQTKSKQKTTSSDAWNDDQSWDSWNSGNRENPSETSLTKLQREERRQRRHKEIQEKRAARQASGAMKLGEKKKEPNLF